MGKWWVFLRNNSPAFLISNLSELGIRFYLVSTFLCLKKKLTAILWNNLLVSLLPSMWNFDWCHLSFSLYCNTHYMFWPKWPFSSVQGCVLKGTLFYSICCGLLFTLLMCCGHALVWFMTIILEYQIWFVFMFILRMPTWYYLPFVNVSLVGCVEVLEVLFL